MLTNTSTSKDLPERILWSASSSILILFQFVLLFSINPLTVFSQTTEDDVEIVPMLECVKWLPEENKYEAVFGYNNPSKTEILVPPQNSSLTCGAVAIPGTAPTSFKPGRVFSAFSVKFDCDELTWTVTGPSGKPKSVTASGSSNTCSTGGNITPNLQSPFKNNSKIGSELSILPGFGTITTDNVYQIETLNGTEYVFISLYAVQGKTTALLSDLSSLGFLQAKVSGLHITGWLPVDKLTALNDLENLNLAMPVFTPISNGGAVTSQGDKAQRTDLTRAAFKVQGEGLKIGVLSDSYNARPGNEALLDVKQGDLPGTENPANSQPVQILKDLPPNSGLGTDEGRAMLQIIHDVAPKAALAFRTGFDGPLDMANGIRELRAAGCHIIVDDITYITDTYFRDGEVAQAVDEVVGQGVTYFSAAGNFGERSYQGTYTPVTLPDGRNVHNFGGGDYLQRLFLPEGSYTLAMQWVSATDQDMDFYLTDDSGNIIIGYNRNSSFPFEGMAFHVSAGGAVANIMVVNASNTIDPDLLFKYVIFRGNAAIGEYRNGAATITGHANAAGAIAVGAVLYRNTPAYNVDPPTIASFSSRGGTPILRSISDGAVNITRAKPDFAAPNGVNTTVHLGGINLEPDAFPNFFGTSAAAPHAAAAAALIMEAHKKYAGPALSPEAVRNLLKNTAQDMGVPGADPATGSGFIRPDAAISTFATPTPIAESISTPEGIGAGKPIVVNGHYFKGTPEASISKIKFGETELTTTYISNTQLSATIPSFTGNPAIRVCNPSTSALGGDGGCSDALYLYPKTVITITAGSATKRYGDVLPEFTVTLTNAPAGLTASDIRFSTLATDISAVGAYTIIPSIVEGHPVLAQTDAYDFVYVNGTLQILKIDLEIKANDLAIAESDPLKGFTYTYHFPTPINNAPDRIQLIRDNLLQAHTSLQTNKVALVSESELLNIESIRNRSFLVSATAEANAARLINATRMLNISSKLINELAENEVNATRVINGAFLINAAKMINASTRLINAKNVINSSPLINSNTVGESNNSKAILILDETDEVLTGIFTINLITGYTLGAHLWSPATLLSNNFNVTYQDPGNLFVNPIGTGVKAVKPYLECVQPSANSGYYIAHFWYDNPNNATVGLPAGSENKLLYQGTAALCFVNGTAIPTKFKTGKNYAFSVEFDGSKLIWDLTSFQGTKKTSIASSASATSSRCKTLKAITQPCLRTNLTSTNTAGTLDDELLTDRDVIQVYPNPVGNSLTIDLSGMGETDVIITIYDALGRQIIKSNKLQQKNGLNEIDMTAYRAGLYLLKMEYGNKARHVRIVKQ